MRHAIAFALTCVAACSNSSDKAKPGSAEPATADKPPSTPATPGKKEKTVKGTLVLGGALVASVAWKPDLAFDCACIGDGDVWGIDATLADTGDTFVSIDIKSKTGMTLGSGKLRGDRVKSDGMKGISASCKPDGRNSEGVFSIDLDTTLTAKSSEVTVKGHLDIVCREGL